MGPPWGAFCQITLTSCLMQFGLWRAAAFVSSLIHLFENGFLDTVYTVDTLRLLTLCHVYLALWSLFYSTYVSHSVSLSVSMFLCLSLCLSVDASQSVCLCTPNSEYNKCSKTVHTVCHFLFATVNNNNNNDNDDKTTIIYYL